VGVLQIAASSSSRYNPDRHHVSNHGIKETAATTTTILGTAAIAVWWGFFR
jgi:hypothetical protein